MSLQIWLPLNGDLRNLGLCNTALTKVGSPTVSNDGKLGQCYKFQSNSAYVGTHNCFSNNTLNWSFCTWIKFIDASGTQGIFSCRTTSTSGDRGISIFVKNSGAGWLIDDGVRWEATVTNTFTTNVWYHIAIVRKANSGKFIYVNGNLIGNNTTLGTPTQVSNQYYSIGSIQQTETTTGVYYINGYLNDVRFYDHALTQKEIKEISKALICHYPLDNNGIGMPNLLKNSNFTQGTDGLTGYNFNSRASYTKQSDCMKVIGNSDASGIYTFNYDEITTGTVATFSVWIRSDVPMTIYIGVDGTMIANCQAYNIGTEWSCISITKAKTTENPALRVYGNGTFYLRNLKYELGSKVTGWCLNSADSGYSAETIVYDTSGYGNNSKAIVDISASPDSPRYSSCTLFNGTSSAINVGQGPMVKDEITINLWGYMDDWKKKFSVKQYRLISCAEGGGWNIRPDDNDNMRLRCAIGRGTTSNTYSVCYIDYTYLTTGWHMISLLWNGFKAMSYVDGVKVGESSALSTKTPLYYINNTTFIGAEAVNSQTSYDPAGCFPGKISDVRIYATALSDADIKELYNSSASIDNEGNIYGYDFTEENIGKVSIERDGLVKTEFMSEFIVNTFDKNIYVEPDGSNWIRIFHHNNPGTTNLFTSSDTFASQVYKDQNRWFNISLCNLLSGSWELLVKQTLTSSSTEKRYRWIQSANPMTATYNDVLAANITKFTNGYDTIRDNYGGLYYKPDTRTYLNVSNGNTTSWWGAMGSWTAYNGGVPGYNDEVITTGYFDLYLRVDNANLNKTSFAKDFLKTKELKEI